MKKKLLCLASAAAVFVNVSGALAFTDIVSSQYRNEIEYFEQNGIVSGREEGEFYPDEALTRAEGAKIIYNICYADDETLADDDFLKKELFADMNRDFWAFKEVNTLVKYGIVNGIGNDLFAPNDTLTGIQLLTMLINTTGYTNFVDREADWIEENTAVGKEYKFLDGIEFDLNRPITRAETLKLVYNALDIPFVFSTGLNYNETTGKLDPVYEFADGTNELGLVTLRNYIEL